MAEAFVEHGVVEEQVGIGRGDKGGHRQRRDEQHEDSRGEDDPKPIQAAIEMRNCACRLVSKTWDLRGLRRVRYGVG